MVAGFAVHGMELELVGDYQLVLLFFYENQIFIYEQQEAVSNRTEGKVTMFRA